MIKNINTIPIGFETYREGNREIYVRKNSCFFCHYCNLVAYDKTNLCHLIQCKHDEQWKYGQDMTDKGIKGNCPKYEEKLEERNIFDE